MPIPRFFQHLDQLLKRHVQCFDVTTEAEQLFSREQAARSSFKDQLAQVEAVDEADDASGI